MKRGIIAFILILIIAAASFTAACADAGDPEINGNYVVEENPADDGETDVSDGEITGLEIPLSDFSTTAKFYGVTVNGTYMEVIAVKYRDYYRTVFNTCQVCYDSSRGYFRQNGTSLVCQNCGNTYALSQIGISKGGCNPYPILEGDRIQTEESIIIPDRFLLGCVKIFANWTGGY